MFEWDNQKAITNFEKHKVSFEEAATVFVDPDALDYQDTKHSIDEVRHYRLGLSILNRVIILVYTERTPLIRIISARVANKKERGFYER